jgi:hypothetical protein
MQKLIFESFDCKQGPRNAQGLEVRLGSQMEKGELLNNYNQRNIY